MSYCGFDLGVAEFVFDWGEILLGSPAPPAQFGARYARIREHAFPPVSHADLARQTGSLDHPPPPFMAAVMPCDRPTGGKRAVVRPVGLSPPPRIELHVLPDPSGRWRRLTPPCRLTRPACRGGQVPGTVPVPLEPVGPHPPFNFVQCPEGRPSPGRIDKGGSGHVSVETPGSSEFGAVRQLGIIHRPSECGGWLKELAAKVMITVLPTSAIRALQEQPPDGRRRDNSPCHPERILPRRR